MTEEQLIDRIEDAIIEYYKDKPNWPDELTDYWNLVKHFLQNNPEVVFQE